MIVEHRSFLRRMRESVLARNAAALYAAHVIGLVMPLIAIPYLARVLRPEGWGLVVFAQSFAAWLALVLEYGFYLSGTRKLAPVRDDPEAAATIVAEVQAAKSLLLGAITLMAVAALAVPAFRRNPEYLVWAWLAAVAQGYSPFWYFLAVERVRAVALTEAASKVAVTAGIFLIIREPSDGWIALALQAVAGLAWTALATRWLYREVELRGAGLRAATSTLREAAGIFTFRASTGLYITANSFILGLIAAPQVVAYFGGAERIIRGAINLIHPATQVVYPRVSNLVERDPAGAGRLLRLSLLMVGGFGLAIGVGAIVGAPWLIGVLLGPGYEAAVPVLRALGLLPPIIALGTVIGIQWALPMGHERIYYRAVIAAAILNVTLAVLLVTRYGAMGMAASVIAAECLVLAVLLVLAWKRGRDVWVPTLRGARRGGREDALAAPGDV